MIGRNPVTVGFGTGRWLVVFNVLISLGAAAAILLSPAGWPLETGALLSLGLASAWLFVISSRPGQRGTLRLQPDGTAEMYPESGHRVTGTLNGNAWVSRWLCVVTLRDRENRKNHYCVVRSVSNQPDAYRRLLVRLRLGSSPAGAETNHWIWP